MYSDIPSSYGSEVDAERFYPAAIARMYGWIALGLMSTAIAAWLTHQLEISEDIRLDGFIAIGGVTLVLILSLSFFVRRLPVPVAAPLYCTCAALVGVSVSCILGVYTIETIVLPLAMTASLFALMSAIGLITRRDLSKWWVVLLFGLIGLISNNLVNRYVFSTLLFELITIAVLLLCLGLAYWQTRRVKPAVHEASRAGNISAVGHIAVIGAAQHYLNLLTIPLFLPYGGCSPS